MVTVTGMSFETLYAHTEDGWALALHHFAPRRKQRRHPVLMVHGLGANRFNFDLDERYSFARAARQRGFDVYVLELRGAGLSRAPDGRDRLHFQWGFGDYAERDMPTAISRVLEHTGAPALHGVGHSMGGMLFYCIGVHAPSELRSIASLGAPLIGQLHLGPHERRLLQLLANGLSPAATLTSRAQQRLPLRLLGAASRFIPLSTQLAGGLLLNVANCEAEVVVRMAREGIVDIPLKLISEITVHATQTGRVSGPYAFEDQLHGIRVPIMAVGGSVDRVAPPPSVAAAVARLASSDVRYRQMGTRHGDRTDYGHVDLLVGRHAPEEVYPLLLDFLDEVD